MNSSSPVPLSVLVVDDSEDTAQSTAEILSLNGCAVRIAACGADALIDAAAAPPDVVLLDIGLPGMNGWTVAACIRAHAVGKMPLVIAVTAYGAESDLRRSADVGIDLHLVKPVDPAVLIGVLRRFARALGRAFHFDEKQ